MKTEIMGTSIHFEECGAGERRVVLLHGWGCSAELMRPVAEALSGQMRVLSVDFPAHGESGRPPEPWGVPEYAETLRTLLLERDFCPCAVVAHSFGGRIAIWLAAKYPEMFERMVLTGAAGLKKPATEESRRRSEHYQRLKKLNEAAKRTRLFGSLPDRAAEILRRKYGSADYNALDEEMRKTFVKVISLDLGDCLPQIRCPVLLLWGDQDTETPLWMGQRMEREIPDAALVALEGGTHFAYLEQNARFNLITRTFLTGA